MAVSTEFYLAFDEDAGDHHPIYVDVNITSVLKSNIPPSTKVPARRLKCQDPCIINRYSSAFKKRITSKGLPESTEILNTRMKYPLKN